MLKIYLTSTVGSGTEKRRALHSVSNRDEALTDCWALAQANEKAIKSNGWDTNLMISSQFDWCAALQQIDKATGETFRSYMWSYEEEGEKESKEDMQMFQFRIGIAKSNSFYLSSKGDDAKFVFDQLVEHTEDNEVQEKSKGIYIVDRDAAHAAMMWSVVKGDLPAERDSHHIEACPEEVKSVARMWLDMNGILYQAEDAIENGGDLILEVWDS